MLTQGVQDIEHRTQDPQTHDTEQTLTIHIQIHTYICIYIHTDIHTYIHTLIHIINMTKYEFTEIQSL